MARVSLCDLCQMCDLWGKKIWLYYSEGLPLCDKRTGIKQLLRCQTTMSLKHAAMLKPCMVAEHICSNNLEIKYMNTHIYSI